MGWAKYNEDIREIVEERRDHYKYKCGLETKSQNLSHSVSSYISQNNKTAYIGSFYIKYPKNTVRF